MCDASLGGQYKVKTSNIVSFVAIKIICDTQKGKVTTKSHVNFFKLWFWISNWINFITLLCSLLNLLSLNIMIQLSNILRLRNKIGIQLPAFLRDQICCSAHFQLYHISRYFTYLDLLLNLHYSNFSYSTFPTLS